MLIFILRLVLRSDGLLSNEAWLFNGLGTACSIGEHQVIILYVIFDKYNFWDMKMGWVSSEHFGLYTETRLFFFVKDSSLSLSKKN